MEVGRTVDIFRFMAGLSYTIGGQVVPHDLPNNMLYTKREPLGVVALITPWNFPIALPAWKLAPALVSGNTVILKPASLAPAMTMEIARPSTKQVYLRAYSMLWSAAVKRSATNWPPMPPCKPCPSPARTRSAAAFTNNSPRAWPARKWRWGQEPHHRVSRCRSRSCRQARGHGRLHDDRSGVHRHQPRDC